MRIQYCSDLHLELEQNLNFLTNAPLQVCGDILILAGDIATLHDEFLNNSFFDFISQNYKVVFWVPGNHEFYHRDIAEFSTSYNIQLRKNIHIVHNIELNYEGIHFIFSTLWSEISPESKKYIEQNVSDFDCIASNNKKLRAADFNRLHRESLDFIKLSLAKKQPKTVVVTHHLPSLLCNSLVHNASPINEAFCVDLTEYIEDCQANFWIHGHSHYNHNPLIVGNTILLSNQLGYIHHREHESFRRNAYFSI